MFELEQGITCLQGALLPQKAYESVLLQDALHRVLATSIIAPRHVPPFDRAAMDGYAVCAHELATASHETPVQLCVMDCIVAGQSSQTVAHEKSAVQIMTGAPLPQGYDTVVKQEEVALIEPQSIRVAHNQPPFLHVSKRGEDICQGDVVLKEYEVLDAVAIGILASLGIREVQVLKRLKIGLIVTGSEIQTIDAPLQPGQIYDSNYALLSARLQELHVEVVASLQCHDEVERVTSFIKQHHQAVDLFLSTGGVSVGLKDIMHDVVSDLNAHQLFWRLNLQPGTPVLASVFEETLVLSLSGQPAACYLTFELLFRPLLSHFFQNDTLNYTCCRARLRTPYHKISKRRRFVRASHQQLDVKIAPSSHASSILSSCHTCNALVEIPAHTPVHEGDMVNVWLI